MPQFVHFLSLFHSETVSLLGRRWIVSRTAFAGCSFSFVSRGRGGVPPNRGSSSKQGIEFSKRGSSFLLLTFPQKNTKLGRKKKRHKQKSETNKHSNKQTNKQPNQTQRQAPAHPPPPPARDAQTSQKRSFQTDRELLPNSFCRKNSFHATSFH